MTNVAKSAKNDLEQISRSAMRLEAWLEARGKTPTDLANEIGVDVSTITRLIPSKDKSQVRKPGWGLLEKLRMATEGHVTANDFMDAPAASEADAA